MATGQTAKPAVNDWQTVPPSALQGSAPTFHLETSNVGRSNAYAEGVSTPPNGGNVSSVINPEPNDIQPNDWQTVTDGGAPPPTRAQQQAWSKKNSGGSISPYTPSLWERAREVVANSAIGHSLEQGLPAVADALHLHPTETVNSPTYQSDKNQLLAPQFLMPGNPQSHAGAITKGALTGAGKLTSGTSMATTAAIAATGGLAAPLAPVATGLKLGLGGMGLYGTGKDLYQSGKSYLSGNSAQGDEQLGESLPNAALLLPFSGKPLEAVGDSLQRGGEGLIDSVVGARKKDFARGASPGAGYFQAGFGPSLSMGSIADKANNAFEATGAKIGDAVDAATTSGVTASPSRYRNTVLTPVNNLRTLRTADGGSGFTPQMEDYTDSFQPRIAQAEQNGYITPNDVFTAMRNVAKNTNWRDSSQYELNRARQQTVGGLSGLLNEMVPERAPLSERYKNLASLKDVADMRAQTGQMPLSTIGEKLISTGLGALAGGSVSHSPLTTLGAGVAGLAADSVPVKTSLASGLFYGGKGLSKVGSVLDSFFAPKLASPAGGLSGVGESPEYLEYRSGTEANDNGNNPLQAAPPAPYRMQNLTPEIIRPDALSRSKIPVGANGAGGVLVRPLGALPAPVTPPPEATPFVFTPKSPEAVAGRSVQNLTPSLGSRADLIPSRLLGDVVNSGTPEEQAAALRESRLGYRGSLVPKRLLRNPKK